jgi:hypothetical protein
MNLAVLLRALIQAIAVAGGIQALAASFYLIIINANSLETGLLLVPVALLASPFLAFLFFLVARMLLVKATSERSPAFQILVIFTSLISVAVIGSLMLAFAAKL